MFGVRISGNGIGRHAWWLIISLLTAKSSQEQIFKSSKKNKKAKSVQQVQMPGDSASAKLALQEYLPNNIIFLLDISNSMGNENKMPLLQKSMSALIEQLRPVDRVALITFGNTVDLLYSTQSFTTADSLKHTMRKIRSTASATNINGGLELAYETAILNYAVKGNNEIFLITDGEFRLNKNTIDLVTKYKQLRLTGVIVGNNNDAILAMQYIRETLHLNVVNLVSEAKDVNLLLDNVKKNSAAKQETK